MGEFNIYTVFVDKEGNEQWLQDGVFCDKPKSKSSDVKWINPLDEYIGKEVLDLLGPQLDTIPMKVVCKPDISANGKIITIEYLSKFHQSQTKKLLVSQIY